MRHPDPTFHVIKILLPHLLLFFHDIDEPIKASSRLYFESFEKKIVGGATTQKYKKQTQKPLYFRASPGVPGVSKKLEGLKDQ